MRARSGFSFVEVLAALVILGIMTAIVAPSIGPRIRDGEFQRFNSNLTNIRTGTTTFLTDVKSYPGRPTQFFVQPVGGTAKDVFLSTISAAKASKWHGPYLDTDSLLFFAPSTLGLGAAIVDSFTVKTADGSPFLTVIMTGVGREDQLRYKRDFDNGAGVANADSLTGLVRYNKDTLFVLLTSAR